VAITLYFIVWPIQRIIYNRWEIKKERLLPGLVRWTVIAVGSFGFLATAKPRWLVQLLNSVTHWVHTLMVPLGLAVNVSF
jgi:hypothetical protein